jgi:bifunctional UDP-N-acetylglucosamine pyrophosphorylase/glucosamine-1-phosphate N-acetyltransferase
MLTNGRKAAVFHCDTIMPLDIVILAAGQGKRMVSALPKVLHPLAGRPLLTHVLDTAAALAPHQRIVVYGHGGEQLLTTFTGVAGITWVKQAQQLGTGHAVAQALPTLTPDSQVLVLYGDVPLLSGATLQRLLALADSDRLVLLTAELVDPSGYGRIIRDTEGRVTRIVEQRDASVAEQAIREINTGIMLAPAPRLRDWLNRIKADNAQGEYYLTDCVALAVQDGVPVDALVTADPSEILGVNDRRQLAMLEYHYQQRQANALMDAGVTLLDPQRLAVRGEVRVGRDVIIDVGVVLEGQVQLDDGVSIGPYSIIRNSVIGADSVIESHSVIDGARLATGTQVGPFARLRPGTVLDDGAKVGNFVETKNTHIGPGSKVNHLSYLGDAELGAAVNVGAGTITCNYDGANKHRTVLEDGVFIGSNTALVAPIRVGQEATVGAGSTLSQDVPAQGLTFNRAACKHLSQWRRPSKQR